MKNDAKTLSMKKITVRQIVLYGLFAAFTAVLSQIAFTIPFTPIPISLGMLGVMLAGVLAGAKYKYGGFISTLVYILLGTVGLPVFANFKSGIGTLLGPTGGYILGYLLIALVYGFFYSDNKTGKRYIIQNIIVLISGVLLCYTCGTLWFMLSTHTGLYRALALCVIPYLIGDALKIIAVYFAADKLRKIIRKI
jgi:biotin transport system substrate-specific component